MKDPYADKTVWFLTGSQDLYGEDILTAVAHQSQHIVSQLADDAHMPLKITWKPVLSNADSITQTLADAGADPTCVGIIAWMHTFSPAKMWIRGLNALQLPLLHLHTQANESLPWASIDMNFMNLNQAAHGDREFGHIQTRIGLNRTTIAGHVNDPNLRARVAAWTRAATGWHALRNLNVARFGDNMREVAVTEGDKVEAQLRFGVSVNTYPVNQLAALVEQVHPHTVDALIAEYLDSYTVMPELRPDGDRHQSLRYGAQIEAALRSFLVDGGFDAFTTNFEDLGTIRQLPGLAVQRLMAEGYGFGGEGDWKTSLLLRTIKVIAHGLPGGTSFMEDYTYHLGPGRGKVLGAHMLEVCPSITADRPSLEIHPLSIGGKEDPVRLKFTATAGPGIVIGMSDLGSRFRLTANAINLVPPDEQLPMLPVGCAIWEPTPNLPTSAECWLHAGAPHHTVLSTALDASTITMFATIARTELALIDTDTTVRQFLNELHWNDAYLRQASNL